MNQIDKSLFSRKQLPRAAAGESATRIDTLGDIGLATTTYSPVVPRPAAGAAAGAAGMVLNPGNFAIVNDGRSDKIKTLQKTQMDHASVFEAGHKTVRCVFSPKLVWPFDPFQLSLLTAAGMGDQSIQMMHPGCQVRPRSAARAKAFS